MSTMEVTGFARRQVCRSSRSVPLTAGDSPTKNRPILPTAEEKDPTAPKKKSSEVESYLQTGDALSTK